MPKQPFQLICHSLGQGAQVYIPGLEENSCRLIFADPPYNIGVQYADDPTGDKMSPEAYFLWVQRTLVTLQAYLAPGGTLWWLCPEEHGDKVGPLLTSLIGPRVHRVVWHETFAQYQQKSLTEDYRFLFCHMKVNSTSDVKKWGKILKPTFNPDEIRIQSKRQEMGDPRADPRGRVPGQVWQVRRLQGTSKDRKPWHPAQLPPELLSRIVKGWSNPGDLVMDAFAGSGNMGEACLEHGRRFVGVDQSPTYIEIMREDLCAKARNLAVCAGTK